MTVHLLRAGSTLCNMAGQPKYWLEGHEWASDSDREHVDCIACLGVLNTEEKEKAKDANVRTD